MTETVVLCGNFGTIINNYHSLQFRVAVPIFVPELYSVSIRTPARFLRGKWESRMRILYAGLQLPVKVENVLLCYSLHPDGCCCGVWWWVVEQVPRQVAADHEHQLERNHWDLLRLVFLDVGRRRRTDSCRRSVLRHLRLLFRPPPQVIVTQLGCQSWAIRN